MVFRPECKPIQTRLLFPICMMDAVVPHQVEHDFSDVFGPVPVQTPVDSANSASLQDSTDPVVIHNRSHSLIGPSFYVSHSLNLNKLTIYNTEDSVDLVEYCLHEETIKESQEPFVGDRVIGHPLENVEESILKSESVGIEDFEILKIVGQGGFAKVYQVRKKGTSEIYAMKVMRKDKIMKNNLAEYMKFERDILTKVDHPFIVKLRYSFQTKYRLYLVLDFVNGGQLFSQLYHHGLFLEELARIYAAEIVSAVSHLHSNGIMHRDLKPENILLDADGHAILTDFGLAKNFDENTRSNSLCGTVEYMAPEIVQGNGHDKAADWWSVGVVLFQMLTGKLPFTGNRQKCQEKIVKEKIKLPSFLSSEAHSLLKGLLAKDTSKRLGCGPLGGDEVKQHKWFKQINWKKLDAREIKPSFRPNVAGQHCIANIENYWTDMPLVDSPAASPKASSGNPFSGFSYVRSAAS
ncbi:serine/threonine-protein kinase [Rosa sericea]